MEWQVLADVLDVCVDRASLFTQMVIDGPGESWLADPVCRGGRRRFEAARDLVVVIGDVGAENIPGRLEGAGSRVELDDPDPGRDPSMDDADQEVGPGG